MTVSAGVNGWRLDLYGQHSVTEKTTLALKSEAMVYPDACAIDLNFCVSPPAAGGAGLFFFDGTGF